MWTARFAWNFANEAFQPCACSLQKHFALFRPLVQFSNGGNTILPSCECDRGAGQNCKFGLILSFFFPPPSLNDWWLHSLLGFLSITFSVKSYHQVVNKNFWLKQNIDLASGLTASSHTIFHSRAAPRSELDCRSISIQIMYLFV